MRFRHSCRNSMVVYQIYGMPACRSSNFLELRPPPTPATCCNMCAKSWLWSPMKEHKPFPVRLSCLPCWGRHSPSYWGSFSLVRGFDLPSTEIWVPSTRAALSSRYILQYVTGNMPTEGAFLLERLSAIRETFVYGRWTVCGPQDDKLRAVQQNNGEV